MRRRFAILAAALASSPLAAKDSLGTFGDWGAFTDPAVPRCYAIALADKQAGSITAYADVATWPRAGVRGQVHFRLSHPLASRAGATLVLGGARYILSGGGANAWAQDKRMDAAIVAAMRSTDTMSVSAVDTSGHRFTDRYGLNGAATAMDAATIGCARAR